MDGSIFITMTTLLVLSLCAPVSQGSADLTGNPVSVDVSAVFEGSLVPAASLSLALANAPRTDAAMDTPAARMAQADLAAASPSTEAEADEAEPIATALETAAPADASATAPADPAPTPTPPATSTDPAIATNATATPDVETPADPEMLITEADVIAAEQFLDEQQAATDPLVAELLDSDTGPEPGAESAATLDPAVDPELAITPAALGETEAEAVAVLESASKVGKKPRSEAVPLPEPFEMLNMKVQPGTMQRLTWNATEAFSGTTVPTPILVAHGVAKGPTLCLTAAVHGDELNGIETVRRVIHDVVPEKLSGTLIGVPIVNMAGFQRHSRYLPDRRDLNRFFPGHPRGSSASRIAFSFFREVIVQCDGLVDLHTGSFHRTNLPQLRANLNNEAVVKLTEGFGSTIILHSDGGVGTLRRAAVEAGIPAVTLEAGEPLRLQDDEVKQSVKGIYTLLETLGMYDKRGIRSGPEPVYYTSEWVRADTGGILFSSIKLGKRIKRDDLLGTVTDPISNEREEIRSPYSGRVIGMALNQFVMPGFATYHIGIEAEDVDDALQDDEPVILTHDVAFEPDMEAVEE